MFMGCKRFTDFIDLHKRKPLDHIAGQENNNENETEYKEANEIKNGLSNRVLSDQLKRLEKFGFIDKEVVSKSPLRIEYSLTQMGLDLNKMLYEKIMWAIKYGIASRDDWYFKGHDIEETFFIKDYGLQF